MPTSSSAHERCGSIESSTLPNTINEILCMGHGATIRLCPVWPQTRDASFANLRCRGAFLGSAAIRDGGIEDVRIDSEKGSVCTGQNPWPESRVQVLRNGVVAESLEGECLAFSTTKNETICLAPKTE